MIATLSFVSLGIDKSRIICKLYWKFALKFLKKDPQNFKNFSFHFNKIEITFHKFSFQKIPVTQSQKHGNRNAKRKGYNKKSIQLKNQNLLLLFGFIRNSSMPWLNILWYADIFQQKKSQSLSIVVRLYAEKWENQKNHSVAQ